jgi:putative transposase
MMPLEDRKRLVDKSDKDFSVCEQCALLQISRSTYYYKPMQMSDLDLEIMRRMDEMYLEDPTRGTRRYSKELELHGYDLGRDHVRSLMKTMGIAAIYPKPRTTVIDKAKYKYPYLLRNLAIQRPNQVWEIDISYIPMRYGFMYLFAIIDVHSRYLVGWDISNTMSAAWVVKTIKTAISNHGKPEIINSDQGTQFTSDIYNAHIERFFRTIKYDRLYLNPSRDGKELFTECETFINYYNEKRSHSSLGYTTPAKVFKQAA